MKRRSCMFARGSFIAASVCWLLLIVAARGATLRELAPTDAGLYVELNHLAPDVARFEQGELFARWQRHPLWSLARAKLHDKWRPVRDFFGLSNDRWWLQLLGDEALLAVWPGEHIQDPGTALVLIRTREQALCEQIMRRVGDDVAKRNPAAREQRTIAGRQVTVYTLSPKGGQPPAHLVMLPLEPVAQTLGIMTSRAELIDTIVTRAIESASEKRDDDAPPTLRVTLNPRPWDTLIRSAPQPNEPRELRARQLVDETWQALDSAAIHVSLTQQLRGDLQMVWRPDALPTLTTDLLSALTGSTRAAERVSSEALVAVGGRFDTGRILRALMAAGPSEPSLVRWPSDFQQHLILATLSGLGPDWHAAIVPPQSTPHGAAWPVEWLAAVETQGLGGDRSAKLGPVLVPWAQQALRFAETAELSRNPSSTARTETVTVGDRTMLKLSGLPKWSANDALVFTEVDGAIWAGSSVELVERAGKSGGAARRPALPKLAETDAAGLTHFAFVDLRRLRSVLESSTAGAQRIAEARQVSAEQALAELKLFAKLLDVADQLSVAGSVTGARVTFAAELTAEK